MEETRRSELDMEMRWEER